MKVVPQPAGRSRATRAEQVILFRVGTQFLAISASAVQEVRSTDSLSGASTDIQQPELRKVRHVLQRNGRKIYVVHAGTHFGLPLSKATLILLLRNRRVALLVDAIEKMATITRLQAMPQVLCHEEREWYRGLVNMDDTVVPVLNPDGLLRPDEIDLLDAAAVAANLESSGETAEAQASA